MFLRKFQYKSKSLFIVAIWRKKIMFLKSWPPDPQATLRLNVDAYIKNIYVYIFDFYYVAIFESMNTFECDFVCAY